MDWRTVACALALLTAGCNSPFGAAPDRETVTPAAVPEEPGGTLPPGVTANSVAVPAELVAAHERSLANRTYTVVIERTRFRDGDRISRRAVLATVAPTADRFRVTERYVTDSATETVVSIRDGDTEAVFVRRDGGPFERSERSVASDPPTGAERLATALEAVEISSVVPPSGDESAHRLSGTALRNASVILRPYDQFALVDVGVDYEARIDSSGRLEESDWRYAFLRSGVNISVVERVEVTGVGSTRVNTTLPVRNGGLGPPADGLSGYGAATPTGRP